MPSNVRDQRKSEATKALHVRENRSRTNEKQRRRLKSAFQPRLGIRADIRKFVSSGKVSINVPVLPEHLPGVKHSLLKEYESAILNNNGYHFTGDNEFRHARNLYNQRGPVSVDIKPLLARFKRTGDLPPASIISKSDWRGWAHSAAKLDQRPRKLALSLLQLMFPNIELELLKSGIEPNPGPKKRLKVVKYQKMDQIIDQRKAQEDSMTSAELDCLYAGFDVKGKEVVQPKPDVSRNTMKTDKGGNVSTVKADPDRKNLKIEIIKKPEAEPKPEVRKLSTLHGYQCTGKDLRTFAKSHYGSLFKVLKFWLPFVFYFLKPHFLFNLKRSCTELPYIEEKRLVTNRNVAETKAPIIVEDVSFNSYKFRFRWWVTRLGFLFISPLGFYAYSLFSFKFFSVLVVVALICSCKLKRKRIKYIWSPHMVSCILNDLPKGDISVRKQNALNIARRLSTLPIEDRLHTQLLEGSVEIALFLSYSDHLFQIGHQVTGNLRPDLMVS